jgi:hypothetical protein
VRTDAARRLTFLLSVPLRTLKSVHVAADLPVVRTKLFVFSCALTFVVACGGGSSTGQNDGSTGGRGSGGATGGSVGSGGVFGTGGAPLPDGGGPDGGLPDAATGGNVGGTGQGTGGGAGGIPGTGGQAGGGQGGQGGQGGTSCPVPAACALAAVRCDSGAPQKCVADGNGCPTWQAQPACGLHQTCTAGACACTAEPRCGTTPTEGDFCPTAGGTTFGHCARDASNCVFVASASNACTGSQSCNATGVVPTGTACGCPADGTTLGSGCMASAVGAMAADGTNDAVVRCEMVGSCRIWNVMVNCGATGLTAGTVSGTAACVCKPATAGTYYVDPNPAMATYMNGQPTGVQSPPACRLRGITQALAKIAATTGFNRIVVAHDPPLPVHLAASTGETFPMTIPAGITVTTADGANLDAAHYVVDVGSVATGQAAILLGNGASVSGLTFDAAGAAGAPNAGTGVVNVVTCAETTTAQTATLNRVAVAAKTGQTGVLVRGACALTMNDSTAAGATIGVDVTRTANAPTVEASLTATNLGVTSAVASSIGVRVGAGLDGGVRSTVTSSGALVAVRGSAFRVQGGAATVTGGTLTGANQATENGIGAELTGGTTTLAGVTVTGGAHFSGVQLSGTAAATIKGAAAGPSRITTTLAATSTESYDGVTMVAGATGASLTIDGDTEVSKYRSGVVHNDGALVTKGSNIVVKDNRANGIELLGRTTGVTVSLTGVAVRTNAGTGVVVRSIVPGTFQNGILSQNAGDGVDFQRTQANAQTGYRFVFAGNEVSANGGRGIALTGKGTGTAATLLGGKVGVRLERNNVTGNAGVGVYLTESTDAADGDDITEVMMDSNDIAGNLTSAATAPAATLAGGVFVARADATTRVLLGVFLGNRVHGNGRHEIGFEVAQNNGAAWNLSSSSGGVDGATACADEAKPNAVYCYAGSLTDLGVAIAASGIHVSARNMHFGQTTPAAGVDYSLAIPAGEIASPCAAQSCQ